MNKLAVVTGNLGFIGRHLMLKLMSMNMDIICLDKALSPIFDVSLKKNLVDFVDKEIDYIFHFGAPCSIVQFNRDPVGSVQNTLDGFRNVLTLAELTGARLVYPSSGNVYGDVPPPQKEEDSPNPGNLYAVCKLQCEKMALSSKADTVGLRIFAGYGVGEHKKGEVASAVYLFFRDMLNGVPPVIFGNGSQSRDFIYIEDVVEGIVNASFSSCLPKVINLGTGISTDFNSIVKTINDVLGKDIEPEYVEKPQSYVERTAANTELMKETILSKPLITLEEGIQVIADYYTKKC